MSNNKFSALFETVKGDAQFLRGGIAVGIVPCLQQNPFHPLIFTCQADQLQRLVQAGLHGLFTLQLTQGLINFLFGKMLRQIHDQHGPGINLRHRTVANIADPGQKKENQEERKQYQRQHRSRHYFEKTTHIFPD